MADVTKEINVVVNSDTSDLVDGLNKARVSMDNLGASAVENATELKKSFSGIAVELKDVNVELMEVQKSLKKTTDPQAISNLQKYEQELIKEKKNLEAVTQAAKGTTQATVSYRTELRNLMQQMAALDIAGKKNSDTYRNLQQRAGTIKDAMMDAQTAAKNMGSDTRHIDGMIQGVSGLVGAFSIYQGVALLVGKDNKELQESMVKLMATMTLLNGVQEIATMLQKESAFMTQLQSVFLKEYTVATKAQTIATDGQVVAQETLNTVTKVNPYAVIVTALVAATAALIAYGQHTSELVDIENERNAVLGESQKKIVDQKFALTTLLKVVQDSTRTEKERKDALKEIEKTSNGIIKVQDLSKESLIRLDTETNTYIETLVKQARVQAAGEKITELSKKNIDLRTEAIKNENEIIDKNALQLAGYLTINKAGLGLSMDWIKQVTTTGKIENIRQQVVDKVNGSLFEQITANEKLIIGLSEYVDTNKEVVAGIKDKKDETEKAIPIWEKMGISELRYKIILAESKIEGEKWQKQMDKNAQQAAYFTTRTDILGSSLDRILTAAIKLKNTKVEFPLPEMLPDYSEDLERQLNDIKGWANTVSNIASSGINLIFQGLAQSTDQQMLDIQTAYDETALGYKNMLDSNRISQEQYDKKMKQLNDKKAAEEKALKHKQWDTDRTARVIQMEIDGALAAIAQLAGSPGPTGWVLFALAELITQAGVALAYSQKNPYARGTAQILGGKSHAGGGVSLGDFGTAEKGEFIGITSTKATSKYGKGLMSLFEGLNQSNTDKIAFGLSDISLKTGFDNNSNLTVSLAEVPEIGRIENLLKKPTTSITYGNGYRIEKRGNSTRIINGR